MPPDLGQVIRSFQQKRYVIEVNHGKKRITLRNVLEEDIETAIGDDHPQVIQDAPDHFGGAQCLILGWVQTRPLHIVVRYEYQTPQVITVWWPDEQPHRWRDNWTTEVIPHDNTGS